MFDFDQEKILYSSIPYSNSGTEPCAEYSRNLNQGFGGGSSGCHNDNNAVLPSDLQDLDSEDLIRSPFDNEYECYKLYDIEESIAGPSTSDASLSFHEGTTASGSQGARPRTARKKMTNEEKNQRKKKKRQENKEHHMVALECEKYLKAQNEDLKEEYEQLQEEKKRLIITTAYRHTPMRPS